MTPAPAATSSMTVLEAIHSRVSSRAFAPAPVSAGEIDALLRAAVRAPTAMHAEPWVFVIIQDPARLQQLSESMKSGVLAKALAIGMIDANYNPFYGAGTLIAIG